MKSQQRPALLALSALLLCTGSSAASSSPTTTTTSLPPEGRGRTPPGRDWQRQTNDSANHHYGKGWPSPKLREVTGPASLGTSRANVSTVMSEDRGEAVSPLCAYRVIEGGIGGQLCFRDTLQGYRCDKRDCRTAVTAGNLVANLLLNGSVLLQWSPGSGTNSTREETLRSHTVVWARRHGRRAGFELSCWWNGSYTQFECAGVHLGSGCRDFLLTELHENIPYRICLRPLSGPRAEGQRAEQRDCVEFTLPPSGMQDIVIAMTTVGGAICVMLVIICLLVAYITENIMSPTTQHTYSYHTHSRH